MILIGQATRGGNSIQWDQSRSSGRRVINGLQFLGDDVSKGETLVSGKGKLTFSAIAEAKPLGVVIEGAVKGVHPNTGARKALSKRLSDPLLISV